ncbi:hypothetical protein UR09_00445 [Candidatus Nitromaritima sp. SCGC AAA799-A02]|nr:hypothetical protein UR09_00445 [Candidatus Nitromaritima sp. SCGC AAA799-A02]
MNEKKLASFRSALREIRFALVGDVEKNFKTNKKELNEQVADLTDDAANSYTRQLMMDLGEQEWQKLRLVEEALEKMDKGQYGICLECEKPIPEARLKVIPFAKHCVECLDVIEQGARQDKSL